MSVLNDSQYYLKFELSYEKIDVRCTSMNCRDVNTCDSVVELLYSDYYTLEHDVQNILNELSYDSFFF
jgi:hypothetical protein